MTWKIKAHVLAILSRFPGGRFAYRRLQEVLGTNRLNPRRDLDRAFELVSLVQQAQGRLDGAVCVEIGTGWHPFVPMVLALAGAKRIVTLDVNPWLTPASARNTWRSLGEYLPEIAAACGLPEAEVWDRYRRVPASYGTFSEFLAQLNIEYWYPADARTTGLPAGSVDVILSSNVLEHIPPDVQRAIHEEAARILRPGGLSVHRFNPQDHYSVVDRNITNANFLRYSSREWFWYGGSGLAYHNRLRSRDFQQMFIDAGLQLEVCRERVDKRSLQAICRGLLPIHPEFANYSPEELAVDYVWIAARKPATVRPPVKSRVAGPRVGLRD